jgi:hypothetical protein
MTIFGWSAIDYASVGWHVFPLEPNGKRPDGRLAPHGLHDATLDADQIRTWWRKTPDANVGIATGEVSGIVVLDVDGPEGLDAWDALMADGREEIRSSFLVTTPRGGVHVYLAHPGRRVPNSAGKLAPNIDVRGDGGYVVAPPSKLEDGRCWRQWTGKGCEGWADGTAVLAPMPQWMSPPAPVAPVPRSGLLRQAGGSSYARTALDAECGQVALAPVGQRNDTLNRAAFKLGTLIGAGEIGAEVVAERLLEAARRAGLGDEEADATLASGLSKGMANPRKRAS